MPNHAEKQQDTIDQVARSQVSKLKGDSGNTFQLKSMRPEAVGQNKLQDLVNNSASVLQLKSVAQLINNDPNTSSVSHAPSETEPRQNRGDGLPDTLKSGIEDLSGYSMDNVKVHRNSEKPAQMQALAYAQGSEIHLGPGQEKHLPHEAWHVVQQMQGRVKPTIQMKESPDAATPDTELAINDDVGLEREADIMGEKALQLPIQQKSNNPSLNPRSSGSIFQFQKEQKVGGEDNFESVKKIDQENAAAEATLEPQSLENKKKLKALKESGEDMGEESQINLLGELTTKAKINRFIGKESTYSKLLRKVDDFNKSQDVVEKQTLLKELKPLARSWLANPEHAEVGDQNEQLKRASLQSFLDQTTSNYPAIMVKYKGLQTKMQVFLANPIASREYFKNAVEEYKSLKDLVQNFKTTYPPSVNLLYLSEMEAINVAEQELIKSGTKKGTDFDTGFGFSVTNPEAAFDLVSGAYHFSGQLELSFSGVLAFKGNVNVYFNSDLSLRDIEVSGESCQFALQGIEIEFLNFSYDFKAKQFITPEANGSFEVFGTKVNLKAEGASITDGVADFEKLIGSVSSTFDTGLGLKINNPSISYIKGESIELSGELDLEISGLSNASGEIMLRLDNQNIIQEIEVTNGAAELSYEGITFSLSGISYNYAEDEFEIERASGEATVFEQQVRLVATSTSIKKKVFDFEKIEGELPEVDFGFFSLKKTILAYSKEEAAFKASTSYEFNVKEAPIGFENFTSQGDVEIYWSPNGEKYYSIDNGKLVFKVFEQNAEVEKFSYNSKESSLLAKDFKLDVKAGPISKKFNGAEISISKEGFDFQSLTTSSSGQTYDVKLFSLTPKEYSIIKENGELGVRAKGALNFSLPDYLGIKSAGEVEGSLGIGFQDPTPTYEITSGRADLTMPNPLNKIGEILGDNWSSSKFEMSTGIPVFPGISAIFGIYIQYGAKFANELAAIIELNPETNSLTLEAGTNFNANVEGGVFGGIQGGSQLLVALALLLRAAGIFDLNTEVGYSKEFPFEEKPAEKKIKEDSGFSYDLQGEIKAEASLDVVATALYFFQKRFSLLLGEKSLGAFHYKNGTASDPDMRGQALASREDLDTAIDPKLTEEASGLTIDQLLDLDYTHRFKAKEKKEAINVIKAAEAGRVEANKLENTGTDDSPKFDNTALANLQFYNEFIDKRCNWAEIYRVLDVMGETLISKTELGIKTETERHAYLNDHILGNIEILSESSNIAQVFVDHYHEKVMEFVEAYPGSTIAQYHALLQKKGQLLDAVENMKKGYLHSSFWGDEAKQLKNIKTSAWWGKSNYENFAAAYGTFRRTMMAHKDILAQVKEMGKQTAFQLVQDHQRKMEKRGEP